MRLTLKVVADAGLLGMPNAGKSTLLSRVSASRPKVADYPFTTLTPSLGVVRVRDDASFVLADLPGLIEGASAGVGLGFRFLKHLSRARLLLHLVDAAPMDGTDPVDNVRAIEAELFAYSAAFRQRDIWLVANKLDLPGADAGYARLKAAFPDRPCFGLSAVAGSGVEALTSAVMARVAEVGQRMADDAEYADRQRGVDWQLGGDVLARAFEPGTNRADRERPDDDAAVVYRRG